MVEVMYSVLSAGQLTKRNFCHDEGPSTDAASYCSEAIASRPATRISGQNGSDLHTCTTIAKLSASAGPLRQFGPSAPVSRKMVLLITPRSGLSMKRIDKMVGIDGIAQGRMKIAETILIHQRDCTKKPESSNAMSIFRLIATARKMAVLIPERKKIGSSTSCT